MNLWDILLDNGIVLGGADFRRLLFLGAIKLNSVPLESKHFEIEVKPGDVVEVGKKIRLHIQEDGSVRYLRTECV